MGYISELEHILMHTHKLEKVIHTYMTNPSLNVTTEQWTRRLERLKEVRTLVLSMGYE
jgi:hypothetical protein